MNFIHVQTTAGNPVIRSERSFWTHVSTHQGIDQNQSAVPQVVVVAEPITAVCKGQDAAEEEDGCRTPEHDESHDAEDEPSCADIVLVWLKTIILFLQTES